MNKICILLSVIFVLLTMSCKENNTAVTPTVEAEVATSNLAITPSSWITERVANANKKLNATAAGAIVWRAMEAHGGLQRYYENGPLSFHFDYVPNDGSTRRNTYQTIDTWSNKARHQNVADRTQEFGWTGEKAWKKVTDSTAFPYDMRFWALTPYYFLSQPFVLDGTGVKLEQLVDKTHRDIPYDAIKVTFAAGTGDAPDDYYVLYFGKENHRLAVIRYIVSYPKYFPDGGHLPEKLMELKGTTGVDGIIFATGYHTHWLTKEEQAGEHITTINVNEISFEPKTTKDYFQIPKGGTFIE